MHLGKWHHDSIFKQPTVGVRHIFSKGSERNILAFAGHTVSVPTIQLSWCNMKAATDHMETNEHGCVPIKLYVEQQAMGQIRSQANFWSTRTFLEKLFLQYTTFKPQNSITLRYCCFNAVVLSPWLSTRKGYTFWKDLKNSVARKYPGLKNPWLQGPGIGTTLSSTEVMCSQG